MVSGKDLIDPKTGIAIENKTGRKTKKLPANPTVLPVDGQKWSLENEHCALYIKNDIQRFSELMKQKGAKEVDVNHALGQLSDDVYPASLRSSDKKTWATSGWIYVQDCRGYALKARRALRVYWKDWTPQKALQEESVMEPKGSDDPKLQQKIEKLKQKLALLRKAICEAFDPVVAKEQPVKETSEPDVTEEEVAEPFEELVPDEIPENKAEEKPVVMPTVIQKPISPSRTRPQLPTRTPRQSSEASVAKTEASVPTLTRTRSVLPARTPRQSSETSVAKTEASVPTLTRSRSALPARTLSPVNRQETGVVESSTRTRPSFNRAALKEALVKGKGDPIDDLSGWDDEGSGNIG